MENVSRRRFLRDASLGAAAVGAVAAIGPSAFAATSAGSGSRLGSAGSVAETAPSSPAGEQPEIMAHVVDASSGRIAVFSGTKMVTFQDRRVAEALMRAAR